MERKSNRETEEGKVREGEGGVRGREIEGER